jgi:membrane associated rhomboid family serine protease
MFEGWQRAFDIEDFPEVTFILAVVILAIFLFTNSNIVFYENLFGFIPARPQIYSLFTYMFVHADFTHVLFNLLFLIIAGLAVEETLGRVAYLSVFFASGFIAAMFDILGRFLTGFFNIMNHVCSGTLLNCVNLGGPFIGASGAIFGVMAVAALIKPMEKVPTILVILAFLPFLQMYFQFQMNLDYFISLFVTGFVVVIALTIFFISPSTIPILVAMLAFLFSWIFVILLNTSGDVSNIGHLGGVLGGLISYFVFSKVKRT